MGSEPLAYSKMGFTPQREEIEAEALADILNNQLITKEFLDLRLSQTKEDLKKWAAGVLLVQVAIIEALL